MLREANSPGLANVRYSRIAGDGEVIVNQGSERRRSGPPTQAGTRPNRRFLARYSAIAPARALSFGSRDNYGSRSIVAYFASIVDARSNVSTNSARATSCGTPPSMLCTASARVFGRICSSLTFHVVQQEA